jgi:uncharacterized protein (DUF488 family)
MIYTIGHGNRPVEEFMGLLGEAAIGCVVDIRAHPASRRHPQFARAATENVSSTMPANSRGLTCSDAAGTRRRLRKR